MVDALKNKSAAWGYDYANEPYDGWQNNDTDATSRLIGGEMTAVGYSMHGMTDFFIELYTALKAIAPHQYFGPGHVDSDHLSIMPISDTCDFYEVHSYVTNPASFARYASEYDKPVIIGEYGFNKNGEFGKHPEFNKQMIHIFLERGFPLIMLWSFPRTWNASLDYAAHESLTQLTSFTEL